MSVFSRCEQGHDLTDPDAYITISGGYRRCRQCVLAAKSTQRRFRKDSTMARLA